MQHLGANLSRFLSGRATKLGEHLKCWHTDSMYRRDLSYGIERLTLAGVSLLLIFIASRVPCEVLTSVCLRVALEFGKMRCTRLPSETKDAELEKAFPLFVTVQDIHICLIFSRVI